MLNETNILQSKLTVVKQPLKLLGEKKSTIRTKCEQLAKVIKLATQRNSLLSTETNSVAKGHFNEILITNNNNYTILYSIAYKKKNQPTHKSFLGNLANIQMTLAIAKSNKSQFCRYGYKQMRQNVI